MSSHQDPDDSRGATMPSRPKTPRASKKKAVARHTPKKKVIMKRLRKSKWNSENIFIDSKSPLATADLRTVLSNPMAWEALDEEDRAEILALFPDNQHVLAAGTADARPDFVSLMNDDSFRHDCAAYVGNIAQGRHDPEWLASAWAAHERRKIGDFDEFLGDKFKEEWEVDLPPELRPERARSVANEIVVKTPEEQQGVACPDNDEPQQNINADRQNSNEAQSDMEDAQMSDGDTEKGDNASMKDDGVDELRVCADSEDEEKTIVVKQTTKMDIDSEDELA